MPDALVLAACRRPSASELLAKAAELYDAPDSPLRSTAAAAARRGFASGAVWMRLALETIRRADLPCALPAHYQWLGTVKYTLAGGASLLWLGIGWFVVAWPPMVLAFVVVIFYAVEAQMVFLFPLALDGSRTPFRDARRWTMHAGGTLAVMRVVLPLAVSMLFGGLVGRGFVRSWCLGCLAVCVWYESLRRSISQQEPG